MGTCIHGQNQRQCDRCEDAAEKATLLADLSAMRNERDELRADRDRYSDMLDVSQGVVRELRQRIAEMEAQEPAFWYLPAEDEDCEDALLLLPCSDGTSPAVGALPLYARPIPAAPPSPFKARVLSEGQRFKGREFYLEILEEYATKSYPQIARDRGVSIPCAKNWTTRAQRYLNEGKLA